jgi:Transposase DDE domain
VAALLSQDLIELRRVAQDGLKVRASAGKASFHREKTLQRYREEAQTQVEALRRQVDEDPGAVTRRQQKARQRSARERAERAEQALQELPRLREQKEAREKGSGTKKEVRTSSTDPEARVMQMADGGYRPAYNVQFATSTKGSVVVGVLLTNAGNDGGQLTPMVDQLEERYEQKPEEMVADGSYAGAPDIEALHQRGVAVIAPIRDEEKKVAAGKDPYAAAKGDKEGVKAWRERMGTAAAKELYRERGATAEWVNAGARNRGLQQFGVRGKEKVRAVVLWQALAHNVLRTLALESERGGSGCAPRGGK